MKRGGIGVLCGVASFGALLGLIGPAAADPAPQQVLRYAFDDCRDSGVDCAVTVTDSSGKHNNGTVHALPDGNVDVLDRDAGLALRLTNAAIQLDTSPSYGDFEPGDGAFRFGVVVRTDARVTRGANVIQRGFYDTPQWKLQLDPGRNLCLVNGEHGRTIAQLDNDIPTGDGVFYRLDCRVTPSTVLFRVYDTRTGAVIRHAATPNQSGAVWFPDDTQKVQIGGKVLPDGTLGDPFSGVVDEVYYWMDRGPKR